MVRVTSPSLNHCSDTTSPHWPRHNLTVFQTHSSPMRLPLTKPTGFVLRWLLSRSHTSTNDVVSRSQRLISPVQSFPRLWLAFSPHSQINDPREFRTPLPCTLLFCSDGLTRSTVGNYSKSRLSFF